MEARIWLQNLCLFSKIAATVFNNSMKETSETPKAERNAVIFVVIAVIAVGLIYFFSNPKPQHYYDYTFRVAENFYHGKIGFSEKLPSWLNEMIPFEGNWYSAFPLGSVLTMLPFAALRVLGIVQDNPAALIASLIAISVFIFLRLMAAHYKYSLGKQILLASAIVFGTWTWTNLTMGGAWQLALGFAMLGELGAIYFTFFRRNAWLAGLFFALAFGNRTEILLTAPIFMFLFFTQTNVLTINTKIRKAKVRSRKAKAKNQTEAQESKPEFSFTQLAAFCAVPFVLGISTLVYNYLRFHSFTDFGYARIPGVLDEPWYRYGIFALAYIRLNVEEMLITPWRVLKDFPYLVPSGFGGAIWWSSPFLIFLFRWRVRNKIIWRVSLIAIAILTFLLWIHGNPGGWQFAYRYAMVLLPWMYVMLLENSPEEITPNEILAYGISFLVNAWATYLFFWTEYVKP
jgi:hypothetical protein